MGFKTELFVKQPVDHNLMCVICLSAFEKPTTVCDNSHTLCQDCCDTWEQSSNTCPGGCGELISNKRLNRLIQNIIMDLQVRCPRKVEQSDRAKRSRGEGAEDVSDATNDEEFCGWEGTLSDYLERHCDNRCPYRLEECTLNGCSEMIIACRLETHKTSECKHRIVTCGLCNENMEQHKLDTHGRKCPEAMTACGYCDEKMKRNRLGRKPTQYGVDDLPRGQGGEAMYAGHYKSCPKLPVKCDFHKYGCSDVIKREDSDAHYDAFGRKHTQLLHTHIEQTKKDIDQVKHDVIQAKAENEWVSKQLTVTIPAVTLRAAASLPRFAEDSYVVRVGVFQAFTRLILINGQVRAFVVATEPQNHTVPEISGLEITIVQNGNTRARMVVDGVWTMQADGGSQSHTFSTGSLLKRSTDGRTATVRDLLGWCDAGNLTMHAKFKLKSVESLTLKSYTPAIAANDEAFWNSVKR